MLEVWWDTEDRQDGKPFRLKADSKAIDAGCLLPNINDNFTGKAPDLGAYEAGVAISVYGPRP